MILGLLGDVHAEDERLAAALGVFRRERVERVLFVGDVVDGLGDVDRCCALLAAVEALGVCGNHERWLLRDEVRSLAHAHLRRDLSPGSLSLIESLPPTRDIETPLGRLLLCHGVGDDDMVRLRDGDDGYALRSNEALAALLAAGRYALAVGGHTHERMVRRIDARDAGAPGSASIVFINPGTLARDATPCAAILDCAAREVRYVELEDPARPTPGETVALGAAREWDACHPARWK